MTAPINSQHRAILAALVRHRVRFVLIGGVAAQTYGWMEATLDVDITVSTDADNVLRLDAALGELGARTLGVGALGTVFDTPLGRLEIIRRADGVGEYDAWLAAARLVTVAPDLEVTVAAPEDILRSKEAAGREKDDDALPRMRRDFIEAGALPAAAVAGEIAASAAPAPPTPGYLLAALGERPTQPRALQLWEHHAALVDDYRRRHEVTDGALALGAPAAAGSVQRTEQRRLEQALARALRLLQRAVEHGPSIDR